MEPRTVQMAPLSIRAEIPTRSINEDDRSVELIFTTGAGVPRMDFWTGAQYIEELSLKPEHIRLNRLNDGAPLLDSHANWSVADQLGAVIPGTAQLSKKQATVRVRFSKREAVEPIWQDVRDGIIRHVSVGYRVYKYEEERPKGDEIPIRTAVDWEPFEVSMVPIPADAGAKVRAGMSADGNPCEILIAAPAQLNLLEAPPQVIVPPVAVAATRSAAPPPKEKKMENGQSETIAERAFEAPAPVPAAPALEPSERDAGAEAERVRCQTILTGCMMNRLPASFAAKLIADKTPLVEAQRLMLEELARRDGQQEQGNRPDVRVTEDPLIHARAGIANALLHRVAAERHKLEEIGRPYRGMTVLDIGRAFLSSRGIRTTSMSRSALVDAMLSRSGMHTTSDFPSLLEDVAFKNLRSAYEAAPQTWLTIAKPVNLSDFKPSRQLQVGDAPGLDEVLEHGEYTSGTIGEAKETIQLKTYGKVFAITRQALINDDLNAFGEVPSAFGRKARDKESDLAWAQITANGAMGDGVALFHATHGNLAGAGAAIDLTTLGAARAAMRIQKGLDGVTPLNLSPIYLIVPVAKETVADQFVSQITPALAGSVNPFGVGGRTPLMVIPEPRLDASSTISWYVATSVAQAPVLYYGTLDGQGGPDLRQQEGFDVDGIKFRCRLDVALKTADWRAIYKNPGA